MDDLTITRRCVEPAAHLLPAHVPVAVLYDQSSTTSILVNKLNRNPR